MGQKKYEFEKNNSIVLALTLGASGCNYLFQMMIGHLLPVETFGTTNSLLSLIAVLALPGTAMAIVIAKESAEIPSDSQDMLNNFVGRILRNFYTMLLVLLLFELVIIMFLKHGMTNVRTSYYFTCVVIAILAIAVQILCSVLQGQQKFFEFGFQAVITAGGKILFSALLIYCGWTIAAVLVAYFIAELLTFIYCVWAVKVNWSDDLRKKIGLKIPKIEGGNAANTIISQCCVLVLSNADILVVQLLFSELDAGLYSAAVTIARIPLFIAQSLANVLLPTVVMKRKNGENTFGLLVKSMTYGVAPWAVVTIGMKIAGRQALSIIFGEKYLEALDIFPMVSIYVLALIGLTILMNYLVAIEKGNVYAAGIVIGLILTVIAVWYCRNSLIQMITYVSVSLLFLTASIMLYSWIDEKKSTKGRTTL